MMKCLNHLDGALTMDVRESSVHMKLVVPVKTSFVDAADSVPSNLRVAVLDDSGIHRKVIKRTLLKTFPRMSDSDVVTKGSNMEEIKTFTDFVTCQVPPFHVLLVDQHLGQDDTGTMVKGTTVVKDLRQRGCAAIIIVQSANGNQHDVRGYLGAGADAYLDKSASSKAVRHTIAEAMRLNTIHNSNLPTSNR
jgi:DNA-binding NarL/FixJ family response regulator